MASSPSLVTTPTHEITITSQPELLESRGRTNVAKWSNTAVFKSIEARRFDVDVSEQDDDTDREPSTSTAVPETDILDSEDSGEDTENQQVGERIGNANDEASSSAESDDPEFLELQERSTIVEKYEKGAEQEVEEWENPDFELYKVTDRYGFVHKNGEVISPTQEERKRIHKEAARERKWLRMMSAWKEGKTVDKLKDRVWKGVPEKLRCVVWTRLLEVDRFKRDRSDSGMNVYKELLMRARLVSRDVKQIDLDINRTYRDHMAFRRRYDYKQQSLFNVLAAYAMFNTEVGYCQGMSQIAALFLMYMDEEDAFWCLHALMVSSKHAMHGFFVPGFPKLARFQAHYERVILKYLPRLRKHLDKAGIPPIYLTKWWFGCFLDRVPFPLALKLWDVFLLEGDGILIAMAYNIMKMHERAIKKLQLETFMEFIQTTIAVNFGFSEEETMRSLRECVRKLHSDRMLVPPPPGKNDPVEMPMKPLGPVLSRSMFDIRGDIAEIQSRCSRANSLAGKSPAVSRRHRAPPSPTPIRSKLLASGVPHSGPASLPPTQRTSGTSSLPKDRREPKKDLRRSPQSPTSIGAGRVVVARHGDVSPSNTLTPLATSPTNESVPRDLRPVLRQRADSSGTATVAAAKTNTTTTITNSSSSSSSKPQVSGLGLGVGQGLGSVQTPRFEEDRNMRQDGRSEVDMASIPVGAEGLRVQSPGIKMVPSRGPSPKYSQPTTFMTQSQSANSSIRSSRPFGSPGDSQPRETAARGHIGEMPPFPTTYSSKRPHHQHHPPPEPPVDYNSAGYHHQVPSGSAAPSPPVDPFQARDQIDRDREDAKSFQPPSAYRHDRVYSSVFGNGRIQQPAMNYSTQTSYTTRPYKATVDVLESSGSSGVRLVQRDSFYDNVPPPTPLQTAGVLERDEARSGKLVYESRGEDRTVERRMRNQQSSPTLFESRRQHTVTEVETRVIQTPNHVTYVSVGDDFGEGSRRKPTTTYQTASGYGSPRRFEPVVSRFRTENFSGNNEAPKRVDEGLDDMRMKPASSAVNAGPFLSHFREEAGGKPRGRMLPKPVPPTTYYPVDGRLYPAPTSMAARRPTPASRALPQTHSHQSTGAETRRGKHSMV